MSSTCEVEIGARSWVPSSWVGVVRRRVRREENVALVGEVRGPQILGYVGMNPGFHKGTEAHASHVADFPSRDSQQKALEMRWGKSEPGELD